MVEQEKTTIAVYKEDKDRFNKLKIIPEEIDANTFTRILNIAEAKEDP